jgi:UDP-glucose 4-epimerase
MTHNLLEACRRHGAGRFVFASTNAVVGDIGFNTITEDLPVRPLTPYGATKAAAEMLMSAYGASYGITTVSNRFTNIYGAEMQLKDSIIARMMKAAIAGTGIEIYGDGTQVRDYVYVDDAVASLLLALSLESPETFIVGAGHSLSINELHEKTCAATGVDIPAVHVDPKPGEMPAVIVDISKGATLGYAPSRSLEQGLADTWASFTA